MREKPFDTPAVVLGAGVNGLGVVRSLARCGVPVWLVSNDLRAPEMLTRYGRKLSTPAMDGAPLIQRLKELAGIEFSGLRPLLFLTQEESVRTVSEARDAIMPHYRLALPDKRILADLMHKDGFHRWAEAAGAPVPATVRLQSPGDLEQVRRMRFPAVLKPGRRDHAYVARFKKAYKVCDADEAVALFNEISPVLPDLILQEWIEGEDSDIFFCLQYVGAGNKTVASFSGRKVRSWPPAVGGTASCRAAPEAHAELDRLTTDFFRATGFMGMGSMEYKRDRGSGRFFMVEPTAGRTDYQEEVATLNGVNIPFAAYCHELELPPPPVVQPAESVLWRHTTSDRWSAEMQGHVWGREKLDRGPAIDAHWRPYDPAPWLHMTGRSLVTRIKRRLGRYMPALITRGRS